MHFLQTTLSSFLRQMLHADSELMLFINSYLVHPVLDNVALFIREPVFHLPLYVFVIVYAFQVMEKKAWWWLLTGILLVAFSDLVSSQLIKDYFARPRPCRDPMMAHQIRFLAKYCGSNGSFTSSHAVNHFSFATYVVFTLGRRSNWFLLFFVWAALVCYAQVYVGVHFPSDVVAGAILGILFGSAGARFATQALSLHLHKL